MSKKKLGAFLVIAALAVSDLFFASRLVQSQKEIEGLRSGLEAAETERSIVEFNRLFVEKVLCAEGEVGFEARLDLENKVRNLGDQEVLDQWNKFVNAKTEAEAQAEVKALLGLLSEKMED